MYHSHMNNIGENYTMLFIIFCWQSFIYLVEVVQRVLSKK